MRNPGRMLPETKVKLRQSGHGALFGPVKGFVGARLTWRQSAPCPARIALGGFTDRARAAGRHFAAGVLMIELSNHPEAYSDPALLAAQLAGTKVAPQPPGARCLVGRASRSQGPWQHSHQFACWTARSSGYLHLSWGPRCCACLSPNRPKCCTSCHQVHHVTDCRWARHPS